MSYLRYLIETLPEVEAKTENIAIAKGKYQEPKNWKQYLKKLKNGH
jgi:hypothetical protein